MLQRPALEEPVGDLAKARLAKLNWVEAPPTGFGVWGLRFRVWGLGFRVWGLGLRVKESLPNPTYGGFQN